MTMKKIYSKPSVQVIEINTPQILAGSANSNAVTMEDTSMDLIFGGVDGTGTIIPE